ncbi:hypothetical protein G6514_003818 [Epicoccum nigrum]|nr:hypothetical protein G6514_003818 [Epicoccum nigrum]
MPLAPSKRPRKPKAVTKRSADWEPYKKAIFTMHLEQNMPLHKVKHNIEKEYGFKAELRQYRSRISQWGQDKNIKPQEMQAIVRKRQERKLIEPHKRELVFEVRGNEVDRQKIERWMKRHNVSDSFLYAPSPAASTPSAVGCHTEPGSPVLTTITSTALSLTGIL